jgi:hypothetical protein
VPEVNLVLLKKKPAAVEPAGVEDLRAARPIGIAQNGVPTLQLEKRSTQAHTMRTMPK